MIFDFTFKEAIEVNGNFRKKLKKWAQDIVLDISKMTEIEYKQYMDFVLRLFSTILLYHSENKKFMINEKQDLYSDWLYNRVEEQFSKINTNIDLDKIDDLFCEKVINQINHLLSEGHQDMDNVLAWLYQYLNINRDDNSSKDTQFFTDQYMVDYLVEKALNELEQEENYYSIDPACGGGNFIVALIDKLYKKWTLSNNLFVKYIQRFIVGYDIDQNLSLICLVNVNLKLVELGVFQLKQVFVNKFSIYCDTNNNMGSLLKNNDALFHRIINVSDFSEIDYSSVFKREYTLIITNPPFKGRRLQDKYIRDYIKLNYETSKGDICIAFIERVYDLLKDGGVAAYVSQNTWMYLESFRELRKRLLTSGSITSLVDLGPNSFIDLSGEKANIALMVYRNCMRSNVINVFSMSNNTYEQKSNLLNTRQLLEMKKIIDVSEILRDYYCRIDYRSEGNLRAAFELCMSYGEYARAMQGTSTGDNSEFVKYQWEVTDKEWVFVSKGGGYCKWAGLNLYKVKWGKDGEEIKKHPKSVVRNSKFFGNTDLVYSDTGTSGLSVRLLKEGQIFIASGPGIYITEGDKYCHLAFLNSRVASYFIKVLTPKLTISATYINKIPIVKEILYDIEIGKLARKAVELKERFNRKRAVDFGFTAEKYVIQDSIYNYAVEDFRSDLKIELERLQLEAEINEKIFSYYKFNSSDLDVIYSVVGGNPYEIDECDVFSCTQLDSMIYKMLDFNCSVKSSRNNKQSLGIEGILEMLAVNYGYNPQKVFTYIINNTYYFEKTLLHYYKHTLHRIKLCEINYLNNGKDKIDSEFVRKIIVNDVCQYRVKIGADIWFSKELYVWHCNAFLKRPLITQGEQNE